MTIWEPKISEGPEPRYIAIADAIARDVESGALTDGARLPTHRDLAEKLGVTVGTVTRGYAEAERRGLTEGEVGRGTFVRARSAPEDFGLRDPGQIGTETDHGVIDMSLACPWIAPDGQDGKELGQTLQEISRSVDLDALLAYDAGTAAMRHRVIAAEWIGELGLPVPPERVVVTNGSQHGMTVALASSMRPGDTLLTAELTYPGIKAVAAMLGLRLRGVALDEEGIVPESLSAACLATRATALYCVPTIQNPTSATMSSERRERIAEVAREHGLIIVEDDVHAPHAKDRLPPIASFAPERTMYLATLSKWVTFGLRIGFIAAPAVAVERLRSAIRSSLWMPAPLMTEVATRWIADGTAARLSERKLAELEARHGMVREILGSRFDIRTDPRSPHVWVHLPDPLRSDECVAQVRQRGVAIAGAEAFAVGRDVPHAVRVSIAAVRRREDLQKGLETVGHVLRGSGEVCCVDIL